MWRYHGSLFVPPERLAPQQIPYSNLEKFSTTFGFQSEHSHLPSITIFWAPIFSAFCSTAFQSSFCPTFAKNATTSYPSSCINVSKRLLYPISTIEGWGLEIRGRERTEEPAEDAGCVKSVQEALLDAREVAWKSNNAYPPVEKYVLASSGWCWMEWMDKSYLSRLDKLVPLPFLKLKGIWAQSR